MQMCAVPFVVNCRQCKVSDEVLETPNISPHDATQGGQVIIKQQINEGPHVSKLGPILLQMS